MFFKKAVHLKFIFLNIPLILLFLFKMNTVYAAPGVVNLTKSGKLYKDIQWLKLLHYDLKNESYTSRALNKEFFFSPDGGSSPASELFAEIDAFINSAKTGDDHPACRFPARYNRLKQELGADVFKFNLSACKKLNHFKQKMRPKSVSLVFVSAMMRAPASMFGHTFIKLNKEDGNVLTDYAFSFVAKTESAGYFETIYRGLTGGFYGYLEYLDFDFRIKYYNIYENRNLWEFQLNFKPEEIEILLNHLWELESGQFKYLFASENCSYYNSYILEAAKPSLSLTSKTDFVTIPADTMKRIIEDESILLEARYYPANILQFQTIYNTLNSRERFLVNRWLKGDIDPQKIESLRKDLFLNAVAYGALMEAYDNEKFLKPENKKILDQVFHIMGENNVQFKSFAQPDFTNPSIGHLPSMIALNYGSTSGLNYLEFVVRPLMHDYNDSPLGYLLFSEISIFQGKFIYSIPDKSFKIKQIDILRLLSISPITGNFFNLSWNLSLSYELLNRLSPGVKDYDKYAGMFKTGFGVAWKIPQIKNEMAVYSFVNALADISNTFDLFYRAGLSAETGLFWYPVDIVTTNIIMEYGLYYPYLVQPFWKITGNINVLVSRNVAFQAGIGYDVYNNSISYNGGLKLYY
ncbi:MAG: DUF4105 domain-containing protein [Spirochaetia bacterium]|nr:DUF4105 domain-containing protein [Spirochaetia bacterium]